MAAFVFPESDVPAASPRDGPGVAAGAVAGADVATAAGAGASATGAGAGADTTGSREARGEREGRDEGRTV